MPYTKSTQRDYGDSPLDATRNGGATPYKMKGHTLPGPYQRSSFKQTIDMQGEMMQDEMMVGDEMGMGPGLGTDISGVSSPYQKKIKSALKHPHHTWEEALSHDKNQPHPKSEITPETIVDSYGNPVVTREPVVTEEVVTEESGTLKPINLPKNGEKVTYEESLPPSQSQKKESFWQRLFNK